MAAGRVAIFPADTVYGLACDPLNDAAVRRLYALKGRSLSKPSAVMFFQLAGAMKELRWLAPHTREALERVLPGPVSLLLPNPERRFPLACGDDPLTLGLRVPDVPLLRGVSRPILQSSANLAGGPDPRRPADVPAELREAADLVIDGGELPGTPSTVVDLRGYEEDGSWSVVRPGAVSQERLAEALGWQYHFDPSTYAEMIREDMAFDQLQEELASVSGSGARLILELGTGTGETARRLLERHPEASLVGIDASEEMLAAARQVLPASRVTLRVGRLEDRLPRGPFDLVASALCIHHLRGSLKADLFQRVPGVLAPGGRFVIADVVVPPDPADVRTPLTPGYDHPSSVADQLRWLGEAGFEARVSWADGDLAVLVADRHHR